MIAAINGEVSFVGGLCIRPFAQIAQVGAMLGGTAPIKWRNLSIKGWRQHELGMHPSDSGLFAVEATTWQDDGIEAVFLSHCHSFYDEPSADDAERRVFHEGIIATELKGQREFSWGKVSCVLDRYRNRDWLVVMYSRFNNVLRNDERKTMLLAAHADFPVDEPRRKT